MLMLFIQAVAVTLNFTIGNGKFTNNMLKCKSFYGAQHAQIATSVNKKKKIHIKIDKNENNYEKSSY